MCRVLAPTSSRLTMCAARLTGVRIARVVSGAGVGRALLRSQVCPRALYHESRRSLANENAAYTPPFTSPPFTVPPPMPEPAPLRAPTSARARRRLLVLATFVAGLGLGYVYWQRNNGGFPLDVMKHVRNAQRLIRDAEALPDSPATEPQRLKLLSQAEQALITALEETKTRSPLQLFKPLTPPPLVPVPIFVDPALPPHIIAMLGTVCQLQGESKWRTAELYYLAAVRMLVDEQKEEEEKLRKKAKGMKGNRALQSDVLEYLDGRLLWVGRQLGGLYTLMRSDVAAEAVLLRSLQLLADVRQQQQDKQSDSSGSITARSKGRSVSPTTSSWHTVAASEYDDDVTAELSEQLSSVFRMRGDYSQAIKWTVNALKMNDKAAHATEPSTAPATPIEDVATQRKVRELHLYTALSSDYFSLHLAPPSEAESFQSFDTASPLDNAYHASIHALDALQSLMDSTAQPTANGNKTRNTKSSTSTSTRVLVSASPKPTTASTAATGSAAVRSQPPMRGAPVNLVPATSHQQFMSSSSVDQLFGLPPSAQRSELLVEAVAAYSNLASVLCARGDEREADAAWGVAERAARLTGDNEYLSVIDEQKSMLRDGAHMQQW